MHRRTTRTRGADTHRKHTNPAKEHQSWHHDS